MQKNPFIKHHQIYTFGFLYTRNGQIESIPLQNFINFAIRRKIDIVIDLREQKIDSDLLLFSMNTSKFLVRNNIHYFSFVNIFHNRQQELKVEKGLESLRHLDDELINKTFEKVFDYIDFQCKGQSLKEVCVLFNSIEFNGLKEVLSKRYRGKDDYRVIHLFPKFPSVDSFFELKDDVLNEMYKNELPAYFKKETEREFYRRKEELREDQEWEIRLREQDDTEYNSETDDFFKAMDDETEGQWRLNID